MTTSFAPELRQLGGIPYTLIRSGRRKTASILVDPDGAVTVRAPLDLGEDALDALLSRKEAWLEETVAARTQRTTPEPRRYEDGVLFPYLGDRYALALDDELPVPARFDGRHLSLRTSRGIDALASYQRALRELYTSVGRELLPARVSHFSGLMKAKSTAVRVMDLGQRWGSCSPSGAVNFHWRIAMAPPHVIDYLVIHELAHLHEPDHSRAFWRRVESCCPDHEAIRRWLFAHGAGLDL